jgi:hypothetical protein
MELDLPRESVAIKFAKAANELAKRTTPSFQPFTGRSNRIGDDMPKVRKTHLKQKRAIMG